MAALAAVLWGINGAVSKTILATGLSSERLAQPSVCCWSSRSTRRRA